MENNKRFNKKSGKRESSKSKYKAEREERKFDLERKVAQNAKSRSNDVAWYSKNPGLLANAANISYASALGATAPFSTTTNSSYNVRFPGIITYDIVPGPGVASSGTDPVNIAADNIYAFIRQSNSGGKNYDPNDLMSYLLAVDEAYMLFWDAARVFGAINLYNNENRYAPTFLVEALGWDYDDLTDNLPHFIYFLNQMGVKLNSLAVPAKWPFYQRHAWLYSGLYADGTSAKAQLYAMRPVIYRVLDDATGNLITHDIATNTIKSSFVGRSTLSTKRTVDSFTTAMNEVFEALINSEFSGIISGDIRKCFGDALVTLPHIPNQYMVVPTYNEEVLSQFQNATVANGLGDLDIKMDNALNTANVVYTPKELITVDTSANVSDAFPGGITAGELNLMLPSKQKRLINMNLNDPKPGDTIVATRLIHSTIGTGYYKEEDDGTFTFIETTDETEITNVPRHFTAISACGTEMVLCINMHTIDDTGKSLVSVYVPAYVLLYKSRANAVRALCDLAKFKFHPAVWCPGYDVGGAHTKSFLFGELDNYAIVDLSVLQNMNSVSILSLFDVPIR